MASYFNNTTYTHPAHHSPAAHHNQGGRNRRAPRLSMSQNAQRQFRGVRSMKELNDSASVSAFRTKFEAGRSFDLEDDMEFCPNLLTDTDVSTPEESQTDLLCLTIPTRWFPSPVLPSARRSPATRLSPPPRNSLRL